MRPNPARLRLYYLAITLLSLYLGYLAIKWSWAEAIASVPEKYLYSQYRNPTPLDESTCRTLHSRLHQAGKLHPQEADYDIALGLLALAYPKCNHSKARKHLEKALLKRPVSGLAWTLLARSVADDPAEERLFLRAMEHSITLAPREELNQKYLILLAMENWQRLPESLQDRMLGIIRHGLLYQHDNAYFILDAAIELGWKEAIFPLIRTTAQKQYLEARQKQEKQE